MHEPIQQHCGRSAGIAVCLASVLGVLGLIYTLARLRIDSSGTPEAIQSNLKSLWFYWLSCGGLWAALTGIAFLLARDHRRTVGLPGGRWAIAIVLLVAAGARLAIVITHHPTLSDDIYRYLYDGRTMAAGLNPYLRTPAESRATFDRWPGEAAIAQQVNHQHLHTVYLPGSQYSFAALASLWTFVHRDLETGLIIFRGAFACVDVLVVILILCLLRRENRSPWWAALYAWNPLTLSEIAGSGHQDVLGIALMLGAIAVYVAWSKRALLWSVLLGLAMLIKPVAAPVGLLMLRRKGWRTWIVSVVTGSVACIAVAAPLMLSHNRIPLRNWQQTAGTFTGKWSHFGSVYEPALAAMNAVDPIEDAERQWQKRESHERRARYLCLALVAAVIAAAYFIGADIYASSRAVLFAMVLFSTTAHPWYLLWALALLPMRFSPAVWVASLTLPWGYAAWTTPGGGWDVPGWLLAVSYVPIYAALVADLFRKAKLRITPSNQSVDAHGEE